VTWCEFPNLGNSATESWRKKRGARLLSGCQRDYARWMYLTSIGGVTLGGGAFAVMFVRKTCLGL
jgi:hypothetical protein